MALGKKTGGRLTKLTKPIQAIIVKHIANGTPRKHAAQAAGIAESTLRGWAAKGRTEKGGIYVAFLADLKAAESKFIASNAAIIQKAARGVKETTIRVKNGVDGTETTTTTRRVFDWAASAWLIERRDPENFSSARQELADMKKQLAAVTQQLAVLTNAQQSRTPVAGPASSPASEAGGVADSPSPASGGEGKPAGPAGELPP